MSQELSAMMQYETSIASRIIARLHNQTGIAGTSTTAAGVPFATGIRPGPTPPAGMAGNDLQELIYDNSPYGGIHQGLAKVVMTVQSTGNLAVPAGQTVEAHWEFVTRGITDPDEDGLPDTVISFPSADYVACFPNAQSISLEPAATISSDWDGFRLEESEPFLIPGRFLHGWYVISDWSATNSAQVNLKVFLIRV